MSTPAGGDARQCVACDCGARIDATGRALLDSVFCPRCAQKVPVSPKRLRAGPGDAPGDGVPRRRWRDAPVDPPGEPVEVEEERDADPLGHVVRFAVTGSVLTGVTFPLLDFGERCVCCDGTSSVTRVAMKPYAAGKTVLAPFQVPVCAACTAHADDNTSFGGVWLAGMIVLVLLATATSGQWTATFAIGGVSLVAGGAWTWRKVARVPEGHRPLSMDLMTNALYVHTENARLAGELRERNAKHLLPS